MSDTSTDELLGKEKNEVLLFLNSQEDLTFANKLIKGLGGNSWQHGSMLFHFIEPPDASQGF